jgi:hypothetical protein
MFQIPLKFSTLIKKGLLFVTHNQQTLQSNQNVIRISGEGCFLNIMPQDEHLIKSKLQDDYSIFGTTSDTKISTTTTDRPNQTVSSF